MQCPSREPNNVYVSQSCLRTGDLLCAVLHSVRDWDDYAADQGYARVERAAEAFGCSEPLGENDRAAYIRSDPQRHFIFYLYLFTNAPVQTLVLRKTSRGVLNFLQWPS